MAFVPIDALIDPMVIPADGVVFAWEMHGEQSREIQPDQVDAALGDQSKSLWLHLNLSNGRIQRWLRQTPQIPDSLKEAILDQVSRSRMETIEEFGDGLLGQGSPL